MSATKKQSWARERNCLKCYLLGYSKAIRAASTKTCITEYEKFDLQQACIYLNSVLRSWKVNERESRAKYLKGARNES